MFLGRPFYLTYNCDKRGRVYPIPHFNYGREDHVRALFNFKNGARAGEYGRYWLEVRRTNELPENAGSRRKETGEQANWRPTDDGRGVREDTGKQPGTQFPQHRRPDRGR
jgi:hypothetical protein